MDKLKDQVDMKKQFLVFLAILLCVLLFVLTNQYIKKKNDLMRYENSRNIGEGIIAALQKYKKDNNVFPNDLEQLVPDYLQEIRPPIWGDCEWIYFPEDNGQEFFIMVRGPGERNLTHSTAAESACGRWYNGPQATPID